MSSPDYFSDEDDDYDVIDESEIRELPDTPPPGAQETPKKGKARTAPSSASLLDVDESKMGTAKEKGKRTPSYGGSHNAAQKRTGGKNDKHVSNLGRSMSMDTRDFTVTLVRAGGAVHVTILSSPSFGYEDLTPFRKRAESRDRFLRYGALLTGILGGPAAILGAGIGWSAAGYYGASEERPRRIEEASKKKTIEAPPPAPEERVVEGKDPVSPQIPSPDSSRPSEMTANDFSKFLENSFMDRYCEYGDGGESPMCPEDPD